MTNSAYADIERTLRALKCDIGGAECHGMLCGMLCAPGELDRRTWLAQVSAEDDLDAYLMGDAGETFDALAREARSALAAPDLSFAPLLPADDAPLAERGAAFAAWCRGYLAGLGLAGVAASHVLGEDAREFLRDVERFCRIDVEQGAAGEADEQALLEIVEFTRMGVLIVHAESRAAGAADPDPAVH